MNQALSDYFVVLRRWWRILVAAPLLAVTAAALYFIVTSDEYKAESILFVSTPRDDQQSYYVGADYSKKREATFLALGKSPEIAERVIADLGLDMDRQELIARTDLTPVGDTVLLKLTTSAGTPEQAEALGYAYIEELRRSVSALESVSGGLVSRIDLIPVQPPSIQSDARMFPTWMILGAVGVLGLVAGALAAVMVALLDGRIRSAVDAADATGSPVLTRFRSPVPWEQSVFQALPGESGRQLRSTLDRLAIVGSKVIMVTSAEQGAGKTGVALTAARVLAERGSTVAFVDFDSRTSRVGPVLGLENRDSVLALVRGSHEEYPAQVQTLPQTNWNGVRVIPFGHCDGDDGAAADHPGTESMLRALRRAYDWVIVDTPAAIEFSDAARLARHADAVVVIAKEGRTSFDELRAVSDQLRLSGGHLAGVVFVDDAPPERGQVDQTRDRLPINNFEDLEDRSVSRAPS